MNTNYNNQSEVIFQTEQITSNKKYMSKCTNPNVLSYLNTERENLREKVMDLKITYNYLLNKTDELWDESEFEFDFKKLIEVNNIEEIELDGITSKVMLLRDEIYESSEVDIIVRLCYQLSEIRLSIKSLKKLVEIFSE
jgi:hypothetical protein